MHCFHSKLISYLTEFELEEKSLNTALNEANNCLEQIKKKNEQILDKVFNGNVFEFSKNVKETSSSIIGAFIKADKQIKHRLVDLNEHSLSSLPNVNTKQPVSVKLLNDGKISVAYRVNDANDIGVAVFHTKFDLLHERGCKTGRNFGTFQLNAMANNSIILGLIQANKPLNFYNNKSEDEDVYENFVNTSSVIKLFDDELKKLKKIFLSQTIKY